MEANMICAFLETHKFYIHKYKPTKLYGELVLLSSVILQYRLHLGATEQIHIFLKTDKNSKNMDPVSPVSPSALLSS